MNGHVEIYRNICNVDFFVPIFRKANVHVFKSCLVNVTAKKSGQNEYK